jgi:hypothetical protein
MAWEGKDWLDFKVGRWDFFNFPRNYFFGGVGWCVWRKHMGIYNNNNNNNYYYYYYYYYL